MKKKAKKSNKKNNLDTWSAFDKTFHALTSRYSGWLSPATFCISYLDWTMHLAISPARRMYLLINAFSKFLQFYCYCSECSYHRECDLFLVETPEDHRFQDKQWRQFPFNLYSQGFLLYEKWWDMTTKHVRGVSKHHEHIVNFTVRQLLDIFSPSNFPWTNPEVISAAKEKVGTNFLSGFANFMEDICRFTRGLPPEGTEAYQVGVNLAVTKGKVIFRNRLMELIQYSPTTSEVSPEPILIIPAWIMKYYILDLSPHNSMVKYLVDHGHTVFMISWKNPTSEDRDLSLENYVDIGIMSALREVNSIIPNKKVHTVGYCIGGTLLMIAAAAMAAKSDDRLQSITLFAAQVDFKDAGELLLFIDESQVAYLDDIMWEKGYLDGSQMAGAFSMLRSIDMIWSRVTRDYLLGERQPMFDLMAWDNDTTRLPYKMHSEYLHSLFLNNDLVQGRFKMGKKKVMLADIEVPIFCVSTVSDHVAPWQSVYKIHLFIDTEITFVLTSGGHNAGIVSEPGHHGRNYQILTHKKDEKHINSEKWKEFASKHEGSWWPAWHRWLMNYSATKVKPPAMGDSKKEKPILCDAPGTYVEER